jgi:hypothetical protein
MCVLAKLLQSQKSRLLACLIRVGSSIGNSTMLIAVVVAIGLFLSLDFQRNENGANYHPPLPQLPKNKIAEIYNEPPGTGLDLGGIAVVFEESARILILGENQFRTEMSAEEFSRSLKIELKTILLADGKINPDAVLFRAQAATLTANAKTKRLETQNGSLPSFRDAEWDRRDFAFTLNKLRNPTDEERVILMAISRVPPFGKPKAGEGIKATGVNSVEYQFGPIITGGMLPFAAQPVGAKEE